MSTGTVKAKQINVRVTPEQERAMKRYCVRTGMTMQAPVIDALARTIPDFASPNATGETTAMGQ